MRGWGKAGYAAAMLLMAVPATAQSSASEGEIFLKAVEEKDGGKAVPLLENPASRVVNYRGYKGDTALHIATRKRESDGVGFLIGKGADPNIGDVQGDTPLIIAARMGYEEAATWMLQRTRQVDLANRRGETALIVAVQQRQRRLVEMLLKAGANPDKADHAAGYSARDYAKRDTRSRELLKLIETVKSTKTKVAGPGIK
ncbi:MAG: ankyrin repeat domain-containing protein [Sphingomicrobium sp.]